jgi:hypothetical protein
MLNSEWSDLCEDYRDDSRSPPARPTRILPVAAVVAVVVQEAALLLAWSGARGTGRGLLHGPTVFLLAALPYLAMAGIGFLAARDRGLHAGLLPVLAILAFAGVWAAANKTTQTRGGFEGVGLVLAYLFQWAMVGLGVLVGFITLATTRR